VANGFDSAFGFSFGFGSSDASADPAIYELKFEVTEQCTQDVFNEAAVDPILDF
jgi:hypothetical protein